MAKRITRDVDTYESVDSEDVAKRLREFAMFCAQQWFPSESDDRLQDIVDSLEDIRRLVSTD